MARKSVVKAKYAFDNTMSKGLLPLIALLSLGTGLFILLVSIVVDSLKLFPEDEEDEGDCCGVCGAELESDGSCDYCEYFENSKKED